MPLLPSSSLVIISTLLLVSACAQPSAPSRSTEQNPTSSASGGAGTARAPVKIVGAIMADPPALYRPLIPPAASGQSGDLLDLLNVGLTAADDQNRRIPVFADAVPSLDNGLWTLSANGQMEITWRIRPGAQWHDGRALTADDLVFTYQVSRDRDFPEFRATALDLVERVEATDPQTLRVTWSRSYIYGDRMFAIGADGFANPIPRHLLEGPYHDAKEGFRQLAYWTTEYVGNGPYRLREYVPGTGVTLDANQEFILGKPKIDQIEVRFITDANTLTANLLANAVDIALGANLALEQSVDLRDHWRDGRMELTFNSWIVIYPQFINPTPATVGDVRFRRALLHAIDRQAMADTIQAGLVPVAHSYLTPTDPESAETERSVVRYDYDPQRAAQLLSEVGYTRGADASLRDVQGQPLRMEVRATASPAIHTKSLFPMVDYWERAGVGVDPVVIPVQRFSDLEYRTTHPSFEVVRYPNGAVNLWRVHSAQTPLPESKYTGHNRSRYMNPELDALLDRYHSTIPWAPRMAVLGQIVNHMTTQLNVMGLFYDTKTIMVNNRLSNVAANNTPWNAHEWIAR